jgi:phenylacetate-CoA ligase
MVLDALRKFMSLRKEQWLDRDAMERLQGERLEAVLSSASKTAYYGKTICDLASLPVTPKEAACSDPFAFIPVGTRPETLASMNTSGSTGTPGKFFFDNDAMQHRAAVSAFVMTEFGRGPFDLYAEISRQTRRNFSLPRMLGLYRKIHIPVFQDMDRIFSALLRQKPDIFGWYPSISVYLAALNDEQGRPLRCKSVLSSGEPLPDAWREKIERSFSCPVFEQYASFEFGTLAFECPEEHSMHVNASSCIIEISDERGRPKKSGIGRILVSSLYNHAMPLIRYAIGDLGVWGKDCSCGRSLPVIKSIRGREDDFVVLPGGRLRSSFAFNILFYGREIGGVWEYQLVQEDEDLFVMKYVPRSGGISAQGEKEFARRVRMAAGSEDIKIEFERAERLERGKTGKLQKLVSKVWRREKRSFGY